MNTLLSQRRRSLALFLLALLLTPGLGRAAVQQAGLQKAGRPASVIILDLAKERATAHSHPMEVDEVYLCILSIQGIVNQQSREKIYLVNGPNGWTDSGYGFGGRQDLDQWALEQGLVPCRHVRPALDAAKPYPVLSYLLEHERRFLRGKILIPGFTATNTGDGGAYHFPNDPLFPTDNAVAAAATCAGQTDCLICTPAVDSYLQRTEGWAAPRAIDCTALTTQEAAYDWAKQYFRATTNQTCVRFLRNGIKPEMFNSLDYFIATRSFVTTADADSQGARFQDLMSRYPPGTICFVNYEYPLELKKVNKAGYGNAIITGGNLSVFSGFPTGPMVGAGVRPPTADASRGARDADIGFYVTDGDSLFFSNCWHILDKTLGTEVGAVPIGWSFNPMLMDLKPTLLQWESSHSHGGAFETVADMLDGDSPGTAAGTAAYAADLKRYLRLSAGAFGTVNLLAGSDADREACRLAAPDFALFGYSGDLGGGRWAKTVVQVGPTLEAGLDGETQGDATAAEIESVIQKTLQQAPAGSPCFMIVCVGDGYPSEDTCEMVQRIVRDLRQSQWGDPARGGRVLKFLRPCDVGATYRAMSSAVPHPVESRPGD